VRGAGRRRRVVRGRLAEDPTKNLILLAG